MLSQKDGGQTVSSTNDGSMYYDKRKAIPGDAEQGSGHQLLQTLKEDC